MKNQREQSNTFDDVKKCFMFLTGMIKYICPAANAEEA